MTLHQKSTFSPIPSDMIPGFSDRIPVASTLSAYHCHGSRQRNGAFGCFQRAKCGKFPRSNSRIFWFFFWRMIFWEWRSRNIIASFSNRDSESWSILSWSGISSEYASSHFSRRSTVSESFSPSNLTLYSSIFSTWKAGCQPIENRSGSFPVFLTEYSTRNQDSFNI